MFRARLLGVLIVVAAAFALTTVCTVAETPGLPTDKPQLLEVENEMGTVGFIKLILRPPKELRRLPNTKPVDPVQPQHNKAGTPSLATAALGASGFAMTGGYVAPGIGGGPSVPSQRAAALDALKTAQEDLGLR